MLPPGHLPVPQSPLSAHLKHQAREFCLNNQCGLALHAFYSVLLFIITIYYYNPNNSIIRIDYIIMYKNTIYVIQCIILYRFPYRIPICYI